MKHFKSLTLEKNKVLRDQIRDRIRGLLFEGKFREGEKIPSARAIAALWGTDPNTVNLALSTLEKEGLLVCYPRKGTYVRKREKKLTCVGVYGVCGEANATSTPYTHALRRALNDELREAGIEMDLWMDPRPFSERGKPWKPLVHAAEQRKFQAFIGTDLDFSLYEWQRKLPVSTAFCQASISVLNSVDHDMGQFVEISLRKLARQGCRSVGLIAPTMDKVDAKLHPEGHYLTAIGMLSHFMEVAGELGLKVKNDWMRIAHRASCVRALANKQFGYKEFLKLWSQSEKPDGLLVFDDFVAHGVILAVQEKQVRASDGLKLMLHKNESIDLFCPMPVTFVVNSEREMARALIEQVQKQFRGESCERISLPFKLVAHSGS